MKRLVILMAALAAVLSAADINGTWKGSAETSFGKVERTFVFKVDGSKLTGETSSDRFGKSTIEDGKVDGDNLSFTITVSYQGNEAKVNYKGKAGSDEIKLTAEIQGAGQTVEYTVKKVQ
jgi:hypothetical protein